MEPRVVLMSWLLVFIGGSTAVRYSTETFSRLLAETKAELARSFFKRDLEGNGKPKIANLTHAGLDELKLSNLGENGGMFRSADDNFLYNGVNVFRLRRNDTPEGRYSLTAVDDVRLEEGAVFFKNAEWKDKIFLVVCYQRGYCEIRMSTTSRLRVNLKMRIDTGVTPLDVSFFGTDEDLFLIVVQDPVTVYRWTGTYFNEDHHLDTTGAQSVAAFQDNGKSVIVVAQNLGRSKVYSKVYIRKNHTIELYQLLLTNQALRILPYDLIHGEDVLHFVFVLNNLSPSSIFWWTGREFVPWKSLENIFGSHIIYIGEIESEIFFFISDKKKIYVYHPTVTSFDLMQIITFDQEVVGIDLRQERDQMPMLVLLTGSPLDPYFKVNLISVKVNYTPVSEEGSKSSGEILRCLADLDRKLEERNRELGKVYRRLGKVRGSQPESDNLEWSSVEETLRDLAGKLDKAQERMESVRNKTGRSSRYHVYGDLKIGRMSAERIDVEELNGRTVDFGEFVSLVKDQTLGGDLEVKTLEADVLTVPSINGTAVEDILVKNKKVQRVYGEFTLSSLAGKEIVFGSSGKLNEIPPSKLGVGTDSQDSTGGKKVVKKLKVKQVEVDRINDIPAEEWLANVLPTLKSEDEDEPLNFVDLNITKLWVSNVNGVPWDEFVSSVYFPADDQAIKGNVRVTGTAQVQDLKTKKINGIPVGESLRANSNVTCRRKPHKKLIKSLPLELSPIWDDSFLKEILNEPGSEYENVVKYFKGTEKIEGNLRASQIFVRNPMALSGSVIEGPETLKEEFWMKTQDQVVTVPVEFTKGFSVGSSLTTNKMNGKTLGSYIWTDRFNSVESEVAFEEVDIRGDVTLEEDTLQNVDVWELNAISVKSEGRNLIEGDKRFLGNVSVNNLYVEVLNGVDVTDFMDLMGSYSKDFDNVEVSEIVIFGDLEVKEGVEVKRINDADFNETVSKALTWDDPDLFGKAQFRSLEVRNLDVNTINGLRVEDKLPKLSKSQDKDVYVVIEGNFEVSQLNAVRVNGINFDKYINQVFQRNETKTIRGEKIFKDMVTVTGDLKGMLNELDIRELERTALSKSKPQNVTGVYTVEELKANDIETEMMDEVPVDQVLYQDDTASQIIMSDVVFQNIAVMGDITADNFMKDCDLNKVTGVNVENLADFQTLDVKGNLSWETTREELKGLSYFLENVVTKNGNESISGAVVFENDVVAKSVNGKRHFNNIDLNFISRDAIYQSLREQEISTPVTFKGSVRANSIQINENVLIDSINGVDITDFENRLVRKSSDVTVRGKKIFSKGFSANRFDADTINGDKTNKIVFYDEIAKEEGLRLPATTFKKLKIFKDLKVFRINGQTFDEILDGRLSRTKEQVVEGSIMVEGNVRIKGDGNIEKINDVRLEETILTDEEGSDGKVITGNIEFRDAISIADNLEADYINGHNLTTLLEKALMADEDAVIEGNVEFESDVTIDGNIDVKSTVNSCDLKNVTRTDFADGSDKSNYRARKMLEEEVEELTNLTSAMRKPVVFMYLMESAKVDLHLPTIHASIGNQYGDSIEFNVYGMNFKNCGLPTECYCPAQSNLKINSMDPVSIEVEANSTRFFKHHDEELGVEVKVTTTTVSYSSRCKRRDEEVESESTSISWRKMADGVENRMTSTISKGFLSDVKFFRLGDSIYVIMAFYFHPARNETNNLQAVVYELNVSDGIMEKVDEIPSSGAQVLEVFWTTKGVILVIGNSFDSDRFTDSVNSAIYRFNESKNKFELLRFVKTHGILSIKSMRYKKSSFIFFVQKQTWPLLILKYNNEYDNYYFSQKLDTAHSLVRSNFLSVSVISTATSGYSGDLFVGIVLSDDSFRLFKYKHIEGFVEESYQEQNNVRILHPFWVGPVQYLLAGSASDSSKIYKFVEQGR